MAAKYVKRLICLANSRKISGRCVAGKEFAQGKVGDWIRPVSIRESGELSEEDRRFENGKDPRVLDIISVPMKEPRPVLFQSENHVNWRALRSIRSKGPFYGHQYRLAITDPIIEREYLAGGNGTFDVGKAVLCISLGELFEGHAYKLIAAVIVPPDAEDE